MHCRTMLALLVLAINALLFTQGLAATPSRAAVQYVKPAARIESVVVVHFAPGPKGDPTKVAATLLQTKYPFFTRRTKAAPAPGKASVFVDFVNLKAEGFTPPSVSSLQYFGHGISREQAQALQDSPSALLLLFSYGDQEALSAIEQAARLSADIAQQTDGLIWDDETRELFSVEAWTSTRLAPKSAGYPNIQKHTTIHAYKNGEYVRAITLGMRKLGLPDVVVNDFSWSLNNQMGNLINALTQSMLEGAPVPTRGAYDLDIARIKNADVRKKLTDGLLDNAKGTGLLTLKEAQRDEGDPDNTLLEIAFDRYSAKTVHERHDQLVDGMFGSHDEVTYIKHNEAILAASKRAQTKLESFRKRFTAGLEPGEHLMVKAPFTTSSGGTEWMWVELTTWQSAAMTGLLRNEPELVPGLHAGATVKVNQADVFDYLLYKPDGTTEGNETGKLIEKAGR